MATRRGVWVIALTPAAFWIWSLWLARANDDAFFALTKEDGLIENAQAVVFLASALVAASIAWAFRARRRMGWAAAYGMAALALLWVAGEEISWGQRLMGFETITPLRQVNTQGEMTLHNIPGVTAVLVRLLWLALAAAIVLSGILWTLSRERQRRWAIRWWMPHPALIPAWLSIFSYDGLRRWYHWRHPSEQQVSWLVSRLQEPRELSLAGAILVFLWMVRREVVSESCAPGIPLHR